MAWQTPKTDWTAEDGVRNSDFNRIEGNILELYNTVKAQADTVIYVNADRGNDNNPGTASAPFKTIGKALSVIPRSLGGKDVRLSIAAGRYSESVTISGFDTPLQITGTPGDHVELSGLRVDGCAVSFVAIELTLNSALWVVSNAALLSDSQINMNGYGVTVTYGSTMYVEYLNCDNASGYAITVDKCSRFFADYLDGNANANGIMCIGGSIAAYRDINMEVDGAAFTTRDGGRIYSGAQASMPSY